MAARLLNRSKILTLARFLHPPSPIDPMPFCQCFHSISSLPPRHPPGRGHVSPSSAAASGALSPHLPPSSPVLGSPRNLRHNVLVRTLGSGKDSFGSWEVEGRETTYVLVLPQEMRKDLSTVEDPFDAPTYNIPEKPVTFAEGASYSVIILAGLGLAALAVYAVFKELIFEPKEYKIFGKALERVQNDNQVTVRIGSPVSGYGQETRNRAARQRIPNRVWTDEDGVEHVEVNFYIRGPHGYGKVYAEMFRDIADKRWKFTYLIVELKSPLQAQLMLESYVPA
ncbi:putative mitochondrial import inner membrane translocase subunit TIM21 [Cocos nucifera]|nr:putative mitochondrial import inner membrane translocase subunit TIM21 [Cocos nucifera]